MRRSARTAALVCTVSHYSLAEIAAAYGLAPDKLLLTPNGVDTQRFHPQTKEEEPLPSGLRASEYILTVGRLEPRKNHLRLLEAYVQLSQPRAPLVIVGKRDFGFNAFLERLRQLGLADDVRVLEDVDDQMLPTLYRNARLFIYASMAEGFGMPVLEAMASGIPVITSNTTSLPEVAGLPPDDAALLCDPADAGSICAALRQGPVRR